MRRVTVASLHGLFTHAASISLPRHFANADALLGRHFAVRTLAPDHTALPAAARRRRLRAMLAASDLAVVPGTVRLPFLYDVFASRPSPSFPIVYVPVGELPRGAQLLRSVLGRFEARDTIALTCDGDVGIFERLVARCRARVRVLPWGVDTELFKPPSPEARAATRAELGLAPGDLALLYTGRVTAEKNVHGLVEVFRHLAEADPRLRLLVVGPLRDERFEEFGTGPRDLRRLLGAQVRRATSLDGRVRFIPPAPAERLAALYGAADLFVNLTLNHDENFGLSAVEAMACGLPAVGTRWGGQRDTIEHGVTGFHVGARVFDLGVCADPWQAVEACRALLASDPLRAAMGAAARARAVERYSLASYEGRLLEAVRECLARRPAGRRTNALTDFGRRYHAAFSARLTGRERRLAGADRRGAWPSYLDDEGRALYRELIAPYASGRAGGALRDGDVLTLRSPFTRVTARSIAVDDPLWPCAVRVDHPAEAAAVRALAGGAFARAGELVASLGAVAPRAEVRRALRGLIAAGVVARSPA